MLAEVEALVVDDVGARLGAVAVPTLVMVGRRDILVPPELSEQIAAEIPNAELEYLQTAHAFNVEEADAFNATVLGFLEKH
jgi:2-hydroxy-6-oxonona-2,4-dienedioate hydrolase